MKRDPEKARAWKRRSARRYEERKRTEALEEGKWNSLDGATNRERREKERARAYGPEERIKWIQSLPCLICGSTPSDNAHVATGGTGRKADADKIVPLCRTHHQQQHQGQETFEEKHQIDLHARASRVEAAWQRKVRSDE